MLKTLVKKATRPAYLNLILRKSGTPGDRVFAVSWQYKHAFEPGLPFGLMSALAHHPGLDLLTDHDAPFDASLRVSEGL